MIAHAGVQVRVEEQEELIGSLPKENCRLWLTQDFDGHLVHVFRPYIVSRGELPLVVAFSWPDKTNDFHVRIDRAVEANVLGQKRRSLFLESRNVDQSRTSS